MKLWHSFLVVCTGPVLAFAYQTWWSQPRPPQKDLSVTELLGGEAGQGFAYPKPGRTFHFPQDHGPHPDFRTEWWYFTGNLESFGYELTFFRQSLLSPLEQLTRHSAWASSQAMLAHFAISDLASKNFYHFHKISRQSLELAGANQKGCWVENWSAKFLPNHCFELRADTPQCSLQLSLKSLKPPVLQGQAGFSQKGESPEQSSHYYSLTRLASQGSIKTPGGTYNVQGLSWMDREWSTRSLSSNLAGWDWFSLQFEDGQELMYYQLRNHQGQASPYSGGTWVQADGSSQHLTSADVHLKVTDYWSSPIDGARYPAGWEIEVKQHKMRVRPKLANQELSGMGRYWEGAVEVTGLKGQGYVEMVGYQKP